MQRQHEMIADAIRQTRADMRFFAAPCADTVFSFLADEFAQRLAQEDPKFDRERFLLSAGTTEEVTQ